MDPNDWTQNVSTQSKCLHTEAPSSPEEKSFPKAKKYKA